MNEPCFEKATGPDPQRFGLWLDRRSANCPPDPFENEQKYPGVRIGARGKNMPVGSYYGWATGIVGLRLFPNPDFDKAAAKKWDPDKFYTDPSYNSSRSLIRPYRVGMSCAFCHVGPNPVKPPDDPEHPKWENLSSNVGAQYFGSTGYLTGTQTQAASFGSYFTPPARCHPHRMRFAYPLVTPDGDESYRKCTLHDLQTIPEASGCVRPPLSRGFNP